MTKQLTPVKSIRAKCLDCCAGSSCEVSNCTCVKCALFPYRFGRRPATQHRILQKKIINAERPSKVPIPAKKQRNSIGGELK